MRADLSSDINEDLRRIQTNLMLASAHLASDGSSKKLPNMSEQEISFLEKKIDAMTAELPVLSAFVLPSAPRQSALCHIARTVCRRAERMTVALDDDCVELNLILRYLNRLSDYLFTLARYCSHSLNIIEDFWLP